MDDCPYLQAAKAYLVDCDRRGLRPATIRYYHMVLRRFHQATDSHQLAELTVAQVRKFQDESPELSHVSVRGYMRALKTFSTWMVDEGNLDADPLARLRPPRADRRLSVVPTDEELLALLRAAPPRARALLAVLAGTGLRVSDATTLDIDDLRPGELLVPTTKNRGGRALPLDPVLEAILALYAADLRPVGNRSLFVSRTGNRLSPDGVRGAASRAAGLANLTVRVTPHVLRHWHARDLAIHGTSERMLTARMGWTSGDLLGRYAPVSQAEFLRDVQRYSPLVRLRDEGRLDGLYPPRVLTGRELQRSKYDRGRSTFARDGWPLARHS